MSILCSQLVPAAAKWLKIKNPTRNQLLTVLSLSSIKINQVFLILNIVSIVSAIDIKAITLCNQLTIYFHGYWQGPPFPGGIQEVNTKTCSPVLVFVIFCRYCQTHCLQFIHSWQSIKTVLNECQYKVICLDSRKKLHNTRRGNMQPCKTMWKVVSHLTAYTCSWKTIALADDRQTGIGGS